MIGRFMTAGFGGMWGSRRVILGEILGDRNKFIIYFIFSFYF